MGKCVRDFVWKSCLWGLSAQQRGLFRLSYQCGADVEEQRDLRGRHPHIPFLMRQTRSPSRCSTQGAHPRPIIRMPFILPLLWTTRCEICYSCELLPTARSHTCRLHRHMISGASTQACFPEVKTYKQLLGRSLAYGSSREIQRKQVLQVDALQRGSRGKKEVRCCAAFNWSLSGELDLSVSRCTRLVL
jgi:hypothetical protein